MGYREVVILTIFKVIQLDLRQECNGYAPLVISIRKIMLKFVYTFLCKRYSCNKNFYRY